MVVRTLVQKVAAVLQTWHIGVQTPSQPRPAQQSREEWENKVCCVVCTRRKVAAVKFPADMTDFDTASLTQGKTTLQVAQYFLFYLYGLYRERNPRKKCFVLTFSKSLNETIWIHVGFLKETEKISDP